MSKSVWPHTVLVGVFSLLLICSLFTGAVQVTTAASDAHGGPQLAADQVQELTITETRKTNHTVLLTHRLTRLPDRPGRIKVTVTADIPQNIEKYAIDISRAEWTTRVSSDGFYYDQHRIYRWNETSSTRTPSVTYIAKVGDWSDADEGEWALLTGLQHALPYHVDSETGVSTKYNFTADEGFVGEQMALLGNVETTSWRAADQEFRLIYRSEFPPTVGVREAKMRISQIAERFDGEPKPDRINIFLPTEPVWSGGLAESHARNSTHDIWVRRDQERGAYTHEYIHTRQSTFGEGMTWMTEGSADYYEHLFNHRMGSVSFANYYDKISNVERKPQANVTLSKPSEWNHEADPDAQAANYVKGRLVLAALDAKIRRQTNHSRTFRDVFRRMNSRNHRGNLTDFKHVVRNVTGHNFDSWIENYVNTSATPDVPRNCTLFVSPEATDNVDCKEQSTEADEGSSERDSTDSSVRGDAGDNYQDSNEFEEYRADSENKPASILSWLSKVLQPLFVVVVLIAGTFFFARRI